MKLFYKTEEVAEHLDLPTSTVEHYIRYFNLKINKVGKNRKFSHQNLEKLSQISDLIHKQGFTLETAKEKLKTQNVAKADNAEIILKLESVKSMLLTLKNSIDNV
jgi:DNA-binding transcriptional MerR regulator